MKLGRVQWGAIGLVTLLLVVMAPSDNESADTKKTPAGKRDLRDAASSDKPRSGEVGHVELYRLAKLELQREDKRSVGDAFKTSDWTVYPPKKIVHDNKPVVDVPPPVVEPTVPPLPFTYLGRYGDTASRTVVLSIGERVYTVAVGEVIENTYRVEQFTLGMVNFTYLPLGIEQHLPTGEKL